MVKAQQEPGQATRNQDKRIADQLAKIEKIYLVMSGKGGVGKSTVSINLAVEVARRGFKVGLMDVDLHGPSTLKMLGLEGSQLGASGDLMLPIVFNENLKVVSIASLLHDRDTAVIWRGPLKIGAIKQFISDVLWDELDYLIIDSPPGTGDEPLTVAQVMQGAQAIVVTTPQEVSVLDIRKSITFCRQVNMPILGIIENMSSLVCPHCGEKIDLFSTGGGERAASDLNVPFLGKIPILPEIVISTDQGKPYVLQQRQKNDGFHMIINKILEGEKP